MGNSLVVPSDTLGRSNRHGQVWSQSPNPSWVKTRISNFAWSLMMSLQLSVLLLGRWRCLSISPSLSLRSSLLILLLEQT